MIINIHWKKTRKYNAQVHMHDEDLNKESKTQRQVEDTQEYWQTYEKALQYLVACESKRSKRDQVRECSRCEGGVGCF